MAFRDSKKRSREEESTLAASSKAEVVRAEAMIDDADDTIPDSFLCPISRAIMKNPVIASDNYTYDEASIREWLRNGRKSPMGALGDTLLTDELRPNLTLRNAITEFCEGRIHKRARKPIAELIERIQQELHESEELKAKRSKSEKAAAGGVTRPPLDYKGLDDAKAYALMSDAIKGNDIDLVRNLLRAGISPHVIADKQSVPLLIWSIWFAQNPLIFLVLLDACKGRINSVRKGKFEVTLTQEIALKGEVCSWSLPHKLAVIKLLTDYFKMGLHPLHEAAMIGDQLSVEAFLAEKADVPDSGGYTVWFYAAMNKQIGLLKWLGARQHQIGASINNQSNYSGSSVLIRVANHTTYGSVIECLLELKVEVEQPNDHHLTVLHVTTSKNNLLFTKCIVKWLKEEGKDVGQALAKKDNQGHTPLHHAAIQPNSLELVRYLVEANANIVAQDNEGETPAHAAFRHRNFDAAKWLINKAIETKANMDISNKHGHNLLVQAIIAGDLEAVTCLIKDAKMDPNEKDKGGGRNALHWAAANGQLDTVKWLVKEVKMDVEEETEILGTMMMAITVLHLAIMNGHFEVVKWLVTEVKANIRARTSSGRSCVQMAADYGFPAIAEWLMDQLGKEKDAAKAELLRPDAAGSNSLLYVTRRTNDNVDAVKWLVDKIGIENITHKNTRGETALDYARAYKRSKVFAYLQECMSRIRVASNPNGVPSQIGVVGAASHRASPPSLLQTSQVVQTEFKPGAR